jgi:signal transduction histidine kinase
MKLMIVHKLSLSAVILVLLSTIIVGGLFYIKTTALLVEQAIGNIAEKTRNTGRLLQSHIDDLQKDVLFLINTPPIQGILRAENAADYFDRQGNSSYRQWIQWLETIFVTMLNSKRTYLKIRFIDKFGQEKIVVSRYADKVMVIKEAQLQNKAHRIYVRETLKLPSGSLYLSEFNLNREHGKVEKPHREVLRSATPIYDEELGEVAGLLIITAEVGYELREIQSQFENESRKIYITNDRGGYLLHPDASKTFGFDLGKHYSIQQDFSQLARLFLPANQDKSIVLLSRDTDDKNMVSFIKIPFDSENPERFIAVGITELYSNIVDKESAVLNEVLQLALMMVVIVALLAIYLSYHLSRPIKQITQVMDDYAHQRSSRVRMPVHQQDEIGMLARSYTSLMKQVEDAQTSLEDMNTNLEFKILERTKDLTVARDEAERANAAKSEFLSRMSHELRTPMNAILGFAQILELDADELNETQKGNVNEILDAGYHLLALINEVLDLAKIESGKLEVSMEKVYISELLQQSLALVQTQAEARRLKIIDHISSKEYAVWADFTRIKQVLLNLLDNAVKYNCYDGSIILRGEIIDKQRLRIYITDAGKGLTTEEIIKLFSPFERLDSVNNIEGTGIGLVITKHLIELMGGVIGIESVPGKGSTFWVEVALFNDTL